MGRGRGKAKRPSAVASNDDTGSGEEEKIPASKRRGRPIKPLKDDMEEEDQMMEKMEEEVDEAEDFVLKKDLKIHPTAAAAAAVAENGRKKRKPVHPKESDSVKEENVIGPKPSLDDTTRFVGFRQNGSRRKNKPRRAAEAGVECK